VKKYFIAGIAVCFCAGIAAAADFSIPAIDKDKITQKVEQGKEVVGKAAAGAEKGGAMVEEKGQVVEQKGGELEKTGKAGKAGSKTKNIGKGMQSNGKVVKEGSAKLEGASCPAASPCNPFRK